MQNYRTTYPRPAEHYIEQAPQVDGRYVASCPACGWHGVKAPLPASLAQGEGHLRGVTVRDALRRAAS